MLPSYFIYIGTLISVVGIIFYLIDTLRGKVKPNKVTFLLWSIAPFVAFTAQISQGVGLVSLMTFSSGFFTFAVFLASFVNKKAYWKLTKFDLSCGVLAAMGLVLWQITGVGNLAILFSIIADWLSATPTLVKAYKYPDTEIAWPWFASAFGSILTLLTIPKWTFANSSFVVSLFLITFTIFVLVQFNLGEKLQKLSD